MAYRHILLQDHICDLIYFNRILSLTKNNKKIYLRSSPFLLPFPRISSIISARSFIHEICFFQVTIINIGRFCVFNIYNRKWPFRECLNKGRLYIKFSAKNLIHSPLKFALIIPILVQHLPLLSLYQFVFEVHQNYFYHTFLHDHHPL